MGPNPSWSSVWYYDPVANAFPSYAPSLVPGGTVLLLGGKLNQISGANTLREVDLAGDTLRETNIDSYLYATLYGNPADLSLPSTPIPRRLARRQEILDRQAEIRRRPQARLVVPPQQGPPSAPSAS